MDLKAKNSKIDRRGLLLGAGFALCGGASFVATPRQTSSRISEDAFQALLPAKVGGWTARVSSDLILPSADALSDKLYENLKTYTYEGPGLPTIMFLIAYSSVQQNDVQVHRPEVCYPMAGYPILKNQPVEARIGNRGIPARYLTADRGALRELILYWTRVGHSYPLNWTQQRIEMARAGLSGALPDGALVRFSLISDSDTGALEMLSQFASQMNNALSQKASDVFYGAKADPNSRLG